MADMTAWSYSAAQASPWFVEEVPLTGWRATFKTILDRLLAICLLVLLAPVMMAIALAVKIEDSSLPVLARKRRVGYRGQSIDILHFRTRTRQVATSSSKLSASPVEVVSPVGRFLRETSMDRLPELFNILRGELSFVGPKPWNQSEIATATEEDLRLLLVLPGLTGPVQLLGHLGPDVRRAMEHWYIDNWSLRLDVMILWRTVLAVLGRTVSTGPWTLDLA